VLVLRGSTHVIRRSSRKATVVEAHVDEDGGGPSAKFTHRRPWRRGVGVEEEERARASERVQRRVEGDESDLVLIEME
jgi:hypothetical protein